MCPRKATVETCVYCEVCRDFTPTITPIVLKRKKGASYYLKSVCGTCNNVKPFKHLNLRQIKSFPEEIRNMPENSEVTVAEPLAELNQVSLAGGGKEVNINDQIIEAIELLEQHGFTVLVR